MNEPVIRPLVRITSGRPDDVEVAAVTAVLCALSARPAVDAANEPATATWLRCGPGSPASWAAGPGRHLGEAV